MTRKQKLINNTITSIICQITSVVCAFIIPRLILQKYGTEVNGLVNSISQFLGIITLLDLGVGSVVQSSFYSPLSSEDTITISKIFVSANNFFRRLAYILLIYIILLATLYPYIVRNKFSFFSTSFLIIAISISSFAQYYFGIVNSLLLSADQKGYIQYNVQILTLIINTIVCAFLIKYGFSIQIVKLTTSIIFFIRPLYLTWYVNRNYYIDKKIKYEDEPIKQKWNGVAQHFAAFVLNNTDNIVLTFFSTLENVSIYSVYNMVIMGVKNLFMSLTNGFQSLIGEMLARKETDKLNSFFSYVEWILHTGTTLFFGCTGVLIVSFVKVYTYGIDDANYIQPVFAIFITLANAGHCLRLPYNILILAAGHYKQTQSNYIIAMITNIIVSVLTVNYFGLIGVAIGTLIAMIYQTVWMAWYDSKNIINWSFKNFLKQSLVDCLTVIIAAILTIKIPLVSISYFSWIIQAALVFLVWIIVVAVVNFIFYKEKLEYIINKVKGRFIGKHR